MSPTTLPIRRRAALAVIGLALAACTAAPESASTPSGGTAPAPSDGGAVPGPEVAPVVTVVATTAILGDLVAAVVGADADVRVLMAPGVDPHTYAASAADAAAMRDADLVVANGLQLEEGLLSALEAAVADGVRVLEVAPELDPLPFAAASHDDHEGDDRAHDDHAHDDHAHDDHADESDAHDAHDHGDLDPHFWFDPLRAAVAGELIAAALAEVRPEVDWAARAAALRVELEAVDAELAAAFATIPAARRTLVTNHDALGYLADRYGLEVVGTVIPGSSTSVEASAASFAALADLLVAEDIEVVFAETTDSDALARQLATEVAGRGGPEVSVVTLFTGSLGPAGSGAETYVGFLRTNADRIVAALAG